MTDEVLEDGVSEVNIAGGIVRINFVSISATLKDEKGTPVRELRQRIVLTPQGVLELNGAMQQVIEKLIATGVLQPSPQKTGTLSVQVTGDKTPSPNQCVEFTFPTLSMTPAFKHDNIDTHTRLNRLR